MMELNVLLKQKECRYLILLLTSNYKCTCVERIIRDFNWKSQRSIKIGMKKAEEKFFINRDFREKYLELENILKKII
jgi:hypothetical protein